MLIHIARSLLGKNRREINKEQQNFDYRRTSPTPNNRLGGLASMAKEARQSQKKL
jgi:hypothetical protein